MLINFKSKLNKIKLDNLITNMKKAINGTDTVTMKYCNLLRNTMIQGILASPPDPTRKYGTHYASYPGNYPRNWSGDLIGGISIAPPSFGFRNVLIEVDYARALESGTKKMSQRPFVQPSVDKLYPEFKKEVKDYFFRSYI
jgi:hypothetical protein